MKYLIGFLTIRLLIFEFLNPRKKSRFSTADSLGQKEGPANVPGKQSFLQMISNSPIEKGANTCRLGNFTHSRSCKKRPNHPVPALPSSSIPAPSPTDDPAPKSARTTPDVGHYDTDTRLQASVCPG